MNKLYKFSLKCFAVFIFVLVIIFVYRNSIKEGQTTVSKSSSGCDPVVNVSENSNDAQIGNIISNHIKDTNSVIDSYYAQLQGIQKKFSNISTCLTLGTIDTSSENSIPVITIDDPISGTINQKINFILPKGQRGDAGKVGPNKGALGLWGHKGNNGARGPVGENIIPSNIYNKVY